MHPDPTPAEHTLISLEAADAARIVELEDHVWFEIAPGLSAEEMVELLDWSRTRAVERTGPPPVGSAPGAHRALAGMYAAWGMSVGAPGPLGSVVRVPMSGLTWVGVHQDERRRGILRAMMRDHLHGVHERGAEPIATLHASEPGIYGRFGYGMASPHHTLRLSRGTTLTAPNAMTEAADRVTTHQVPIDTDEAAAVVHQVHQRAAETCVGAITRGEDIHRTWWRDHPTVRRDKEPLQVLFATRDDHVTGWAVFRRRSKWSDAGIPEGVLAVTEMGALDSPSLLALGRRLLDFDLTSAIELQSRPADDPLLAWAGHPRGALTHRGDSLWVRLVDLPDALQRRGYATAVDVTVQVHDALCPWNDGTWHLGIDDTGRAHVTESTQQPDLSLDVQVLGAAYLGGISVAAQAAAGLVDEHRAGSVGELSRAMRSDLEPVGAFGF